MPKHQGPRRPPVTLYKHPLMYEGVMYTSRRRALRAKREAGDTGPTLRKRGDKGVR